MSCILVRTGSILDFVHRRSLISAGSLRPSLSSHFQDDEEVSSWSPKLCLRSTNKRKKKIRRAMSDSSLIQLHSSASEDHRSASFSEAIVEDEMEGRSVGGRWWRGNESSINEMEGRSGGDQWWRGNGSSINETEGRSACGRWWRENGSSINEMEGRSGGDQWWRENGSSNGRRSEIVEYYERMVESNPGDSLLLRNFGKYLHEVENDLDKAEELYGRAILASPGDGELLALYGNLIWETQRDQDRAQSYFDQALVASPNDCMVLGSYAHFLWEAEPEEGGMENFQPEANSLPLLT